MPKNLLHSPKMWSCRHFIFIVTFLVLFHSSSGMRCESNKKKFLVNLIDQNLLSCPPIFGDEDDKFCCTRRDGTMYCCDASEFLEENGIGFVIPVLVSLLVALMIVCCVCCLCCPCCLWYKRRNRGTVYNNMPPVSMTVQPAVPQHGPHSDVYQQQPPPYPVMPMPQPQHQGVYPPVPPHGVHAQQQYPPSPYPPAVPPHGQQPPPYNEATSNQMYTRQSPYNPNF